MYKEKRNDSAALERYKKLNQLQQFSIEDVHLIVEQAEQGTSKQYRILFRDYSLSTENSKPIIDHVIIVTLSNKQFDVE